jgi:hypothetical protein
VECSKAPFSNNSDDEDDDDDDDEAAASTSSDESCQPAAAAAAPTPAARPSSPTAAIAWDDDDCSTPTSFDDDNADDQGWMVQRPRDREAARVITAFSSEHSRPPNDIMDHLLQTLYEDQMLEAGWRVSFVDRHLPAERRTYNYAPSADGGEFQRAKRLFGKLPSAMKLLETAGGLKPATQRMVLTRIRRNRLQLQTLRRDPLRRGLGRVMAASPELSEYVQDLVERRGFGCVGGDEDEDDDDDCDDFLERRGRKRNRGDVRMACWYDADMQYVNGRSKIYKHQPDAMGICPPNSVQTGLLARWTIAKASEPSFDRERVPGGAPRRGATEPKPSWDARFPYSQRAPNARLPPLMSESSRWQTNLFTG